MKSQDNSNTQNTVNSSDQKTMTTKCRESESETNLSEECNEELESLSKVSQFLPPPPIPPKSSLLVQKLRAFGAGVSSMIGSTNPKVVTLHPVQSSDNIVTTDAAKGEDASIIDETESSNKVSTSKNLKIEESSEDVFFDEGDPWAEAVVSPCVHQNLLTAEITIPIPPSSSTSTSHTSHISMSLHNIERCGSGEAEITKEVIEVPTNHNEEVHCPPQKHGGSGQAEDGTLLLLDPTTPNLDLAKIESSSPSSPSLPSKSQSLSLTFSNDAFLETRPALEGMGENTMEKEDEAMEINTVIVSKLQELVIKGTKKSKKKSSSCSSTRDVEMPEVRTTVENPQLPLTTCIKYKVHQSPNGVTTISIDPKADPVTLLTPPPIIHHIINLPPRRANFIRNRRRKTEDFSYQKSSRLSQLMMTDYKTNTDRPNSVNLGSTSNSVVSTTAIGNGLIEGKNLIKGNVESMGRTVRRKVGSWYRRRVKTPVEQLSLGFDSIRFPMFKCSGNHDGENAVSSLPPPPLPLHENQDAMLGCSPEPEEIESPTTDQRFVEGLACDQGQNEFEDLRRVVKQGGDFCKDLAAVLQERSELEAQYAKGLSKLSAKLLKASKEATGSVAHAWQAVAVQIDTQAELHRIWSTALLDDVAKPLRNSTETQHKIRKSVEVLVEKTTRNLAEWRTAEAKAKRQCFSSSKEFEKIQENTAALSPIVSNGPLSNGGTLTQVSTTNLHNHTNSVLAEVRARSRILSVPPPDKDPIKLEAKRRKAEEAVRRADIEYYTFCVRSERARLEWEGAIRNGSTCLRTLEEEKLDLLRELACKYFQHFNEFIPKLLRSSESLEEPIKSCSVDQDMHSIVDIRRHAGSEQLLPDFYAEDTSNLMNKERRMEALQKFLYIIKQDLERERKGAIGIEGMAKAIGDSPPKIDTAHHDISDKLYYVKAMLLYLQGAKTKIENAISDQESCQRTNATITQYMRHQRDKQGLPQTILKVPTWARDECLNYRASATDSGSGRSLSPDWREKDRGLADGNSNRQDPDYDEFSSEGSEHIMEEVFDDAIPKTINNEIQLVTAVVTNAPSIGRCRVIYDYESNMFDELTIRTGDILNVHDKQEDGWWLGELNGHVGIFPATYVQLVENENDTNISSS